MTTPSPAFTAHLDPAAAGPFECGTLQWVREFGAADRPQLAAGYWFVTTDEAPEPFPMTPDFDESFHLLTGRIRIEFLDGGDDIELVAGSAISYNAGTRMRWTVLENASKFFVYSAPEAA